MKIVIVGGVAGGASAAARARRLAEHAEIILLQSGPDVSFASCGMPYYIGREITDRGKMSVQTPSSLRDRLNLDVRVNTRVTEINTPDKLVIAHNEKTGEFYAEAYDHLVLAVGAFPLKPPIPGINRPGLFSLRNLEDMDAIANWIDTKSATVPNMHGVVAGAGFVGLEMVEQLVNRNMRVTLVEMLPQILGPIDPEMAAILHHHLEQHGVTVIVNDGIKEFTEDPQDPEATVLRLASGRVLPSAQFTILGLGVRPDTEVVKQAGIACTPRGHIVVDDYLHTSAPDVWAVGDAIEVGNPILAADGEYGKWAVPLAGPANRQGRTVADNICLDRRRKYKGTYGVSVVRAFDLYAACVGINAKMLAAMKIPFKTVHLHPNSHAGYYPGASQIHLKLLFCSETGKIYGAQALGKEGVEKRIDVIATAMQGGLTVADLAELELCYAPPVGSAKDPVNYAGMMAQNIVEGLASSVEWFDLDQLARNENTFILDVRNAEEIVSTGAVSEHAVNIPLNSLRGRLGEVPIDKHIVVSCVSGQRAYYACRILQQNGFKETDYLNGAYLTFHPIHPDAAL